MNSPTQKLSKPKIEEEDEPSRMTKDFVKAKLLIKPYI